MEKESGITVELLYYNDLANLQRSVPTYIDFVKSVIAIDGRHRTEKEQHELSDDGSTEYLKSLDKVKVYAYPNGYEVEKRGFCKWVCTSTDLIIIDSDEYVVGDWEEFFKSYEKIRLYDKTHLDLYKVRIQRLDSSDMFNYHPLLFHHPQQFTYYKKHHNIPIKIDDRNKPDVFAPESYHHPVNGITIMHDHKLRTPQHMKVREEHLKYINSL